LIETSQTILNQNKLLGHEQNKNETLRAKKVLLPNKTISQKMALTEVKWPKQENKDRQEKY